VNLPTRPQTGLLLLALSMGPLTACNMLTGVGDLTVSEGDGGAGGSGVTTAGTSGTTATSSGNGTSASGAGGGASAGTTAASTTAASTTAASTSAGATTGSGGPADASQMCVDSINKFRATLGLPPYARWDQEEMCAGDEAGKDAAANTAHSAFGSCGEWAQNECPGWPGPPESMIGGCMKMMWDEGPGDFNAGHGHYINMSSTQYTKVACGFHVLPDGSVWAAQDFQ
jgi:hypothetical protein